MMDNKPTNKELDEIHSMFALADTSVPTSVSQSVDNPDNRRQGETYEQWGTRICGVVTGSLTALPPCLQKVRNAIYNEQVHDKERIAQAKDNIKSSIERCRGEIDAVNQKILENEHRQEETVKKIDDLKQERRQIESGKEEVNKEQRLRLIIGLVIIVPLTIYLFMFYSSTFYSAFFRDPATLTNVMNTMFDAKALNHAYAEGLFELMFVLSAPIIFLGLGYVLHIFSMEKDKTKYFKMAAILLVTLMFDCILAYKIGEQMHSLGVIIGTYPIGEPYTISMAIHDINTWAVIFCGFIVYVIWGFVFDMIMEAYNKMDMRKARLAAIDADVKGFEDNLDVQKSKISELKTNVKALETKINALTQRLGTDIFISIDQIKTEMTNFFLGWIKMMTVLSISVEIQNEAKRVFENELATLTKD
ncbi:MAG: hypothetical protein IKP73_05880 [Bacteroidales bacterium]|nr:hypothetical protein [Bacteroidales bacterium]